MRESWKRNKSSPRIVTPGLVWFPTLSDGKKWPNRTSPIDSHIGRWPRLLEKTAREESIRGPPEEGPEKGRRRETTGDKKSRREGRRWRR